MVLMTLTQIATDSQTLLTAQWGTVMTTDISPSLESKIDSQAQLYLVIYFYLSSLSAFSANWDCESLNGASISFSRVSILVSVAGVNLAGSITVQ